MCFHDMSEQVDYLVKARNSGLLRENAHFVLTLKCVRSKAKAAVDRQVNEEAKRFDGIASHVKVLHLFSNRSQERTVVGCFAAQ